jgi:hypothetical protein
MKKMIIEIEEFDPTQHALIWTDCGTIQPIVTFPRCIDYDRSRKVHNLQLNGLSIECFIECMKELGFEDPNEPLPSSSADSDATCTIKHLLKIPFPIWSLEVQGKRLEIEFRDDQTEVRCDRKFLGYAYFT